MEEETERDATSAHFTIYRSSLQRWSLRVTNLGPSVLVIGHSRDIICILGAQTKSNRWIKGSLGVLDNEFFQLEFSSSETIYRCEYEYNDQTPHAVKRGRQSTTALSNRDIEVAMDSAVQYILDKSHLEVTLIKITDATEDSFVISIESRATGTGPVPAKMAPMEVDLVFDGACFGKLKLPEVATRSSGCDVNIYDQLISVIDLEAFKAFVKSLMRDEKLTLTLDNGKCTITTFRFLSANCTYKKDLHFKGLNGPAVQIVNTTAGANTVRVANPSPVHIDYRMSKFEIQTVDGQTVAELQGPMVIQRGEQEITMNITRRRGAPVEGEGHRLVGIGTEDNAWTNDTLRFFQVPITLTEQFRSFYQPS